MASAPFGGGLNGVDDVLVAGAAAEITGDALPDLTFGGIRIVLEERDRCHDHPGGAIPALKAVFVPEAFLQRMQLTLGRESLDGGDGRPICLNREDRAGLRAATVDEHGAGAALARVAPDVGAGQRSCSRRK